MIKKYIVKRTVTITTTDVVFEDADTKDVKEAFDNGLSLAGEISKLNFADYHDNVSYSSCDTVVEEANIEESNMEDCIYLIENTVDEYRTRVSGYFKTYEDAYEALKECSDWFNDKGTGRIYKVSFGLHTKKEKVYDSYNQGPAK